jgi:hypothetical protein
VTIEKRDDYSYGESQADLREEIESYAAAVGYAAEHFADARCQCLSSRFQLSLDDNEGAAVRACVECGARHPIGDSSDYIEDAELEDCACPCGCESLEITVSVSLYQRSKAVRWFYLGCRCTACGLVAVYGDWKNEHDDYTALLANA